MTANLETDLDTILSILPTEDAEKVRNCYATGQKLSSKKKKQHYGQTYSTLVEEKNKRNLVHTCYVLVFDIEGYKCGKEFNAQEHHKRLASVVTVTRRWGSDIVQHYGFSAQNRSYWDRLRQIAIAHDWQEAVVLFNASIYRKSREHKWSKEVENCVNPITDWVLRSAIQHSGPVEDPSSLPHDCGKDFYGLIVRTKFAKSSQATPDYYDGPTPTSLPKTHTPIKSNEPISPTPTQHDNSNSSTTIAQEQTTTTPPRSSSCLPETPLSQSLPVSPAIDNGDMAMGDDGRGDTNSTANGPTVPSPALSAAYNVIHSLAPSISSHLSPTSPSSSSSDVTASQSSPSSLSIARTSSEADTTTTICGSPLPPSPELSSTSSQRGPLKSAPASQKDDYIDVSIDWDERSDPPNANNPTITISSLLSPSSPLPTSSKQQSYYPPDVALESVSPSTARPVQGSTLLSLALPEKATSSLLEETEDFSSQDGNVHTINQAAIPYPHSAAPPLPTASLLHSQTDTLSIDSCPSSPLFVAPSTPKSAWLRDVPSSIHRLDEKGWLNDTIVNGYMHLITGNHDVCFLSSHFLERFNPNMRWRFENGKCPLESEFVLMPINENYHWYLLVMYKRYFPATDHHERVVCFLDSLGASMHISSFKNWTKYLEARGDRWTVQKKEVQVPQQKNLFDCGVFVLGFVETILQNVQGFIESIDGGKELVWEFDGQTLRDHIRDNLTLAADAEELFAKLQARGSPLTDKLETLKYKQFLGGLELPLLRQKVKAPHDEVVIGIEPSTSPSDARVVTSDSCKPHIIAAKNVLVERPNSEPPRKRRRQIVDQHDNLGSFSSVQTPTIPHSEQAAVLMASEGHVRVSEVERDSYILNDAQAKWAVKRHGLEIFNIINLETALDCDGRYGSFITFTISEEEANSLAICRGEGPDEPTEVRGNCTQITQDGMQIALKEEGILR
ncbi:cysteine proteinase [Apiospora marii]|uniref:cysteine proteinase n=1 Tax=Apiospora marii TaxID=335849 RepID=UPI00312D0CEC